MNAADDHADDPPTWVEWEPATPVTVRNLAGIYRYRHHFRGASGQVMVSLIGGRPPTKTVEADPSAVSPVDPTDMEMVKHASQRGPMLLDDHQQVSLLAWDVNRPKAKVIKPSGAVLTVAKERLKKPQGDLPNDDAEMALRAGPVRVGHAERPVEDRTQTCADDHHGDLERLDQ